MDKEKYIRAIVEVCTLLDEKYDIEEALMMVTQRLLDGCEQELSSYIGKSIDSLKCNASDSLERLMDVQGVIHICEDLKNIFLYIHKDLAKLGASISLNKKTKNMVVLKMGALSRRGVYSGDVIDVSGNLFYHAVLNADGRKEAAFDAESEQGDGGNIFRYSAPQAHSERYKETANGDKSSGGS